MCLAIPQKVIEVKNGWAVVKSEKHQHRVNLSLLKNVKVGNYLIVHDDLAINKLSKKEAEKILGILNAPNK